MSNIDMRAR